MGVLLFCQRSHLGFCLTLLLALSLCYGKHGTVDVIGFMEYKQYTRDRLMVRQASSGTRMTLECKSTGRHLRTFGAGDVDEKGNFKINLLNDEILKHGMKKGNCFLKLHSAPGASCPVQNGQTAALVMIFKSVDKVKQTSALRRKLKFSYKTCTSKMFSPSHRNKQFKGRMETLGVVKKKLIPPTVSKPRKLFQLPFFPPLFPPFPIVQIPSPTIAPPVENPAPTPVPAHANASSPPSPAFKQPSPAPNLVYPEPSPPPDPISNTPVLVPPPACEMPSPPQAPPAATPYINNPSPQPSPTYKNAPPPESRKLLPPMAPPVPLNPKKPIPPPYIAPSPMQKKPLPPPLAPTYRKPLPPPLKSPGPILAKPSPPPVPTFKKPAPPLLTPTPVKQPDAPASAPTSPTPVSIPSPKPIHQKPAPSPLPVGKPTPKTNHPVSRPPPAKSRHSFSPIPRAPPIPTLPPIPTVPRRFFNGPKSGNQPPRPPS